MIIIITYLWLYMGIQDPFSYDIFFLLFFSLLFCFLLFRVSCLCFLWWEGEPSSRPSSSYFLYFSRPPPSPEPAPTPTASPYPSLIDDRRHHHQLHHLFAIARAHHHHLLHLFSSFFSGSLATTINIIFLSFLLGHHLTSISIILLHLLLEVAAWRCCRWCRCLLLSSPPLAASVSTSWSPRRQKQMLKLPSSADMSSVAWCCRCCWFGWSDVVAANVAVTVSPSSSTLDGYQLRRDIRGEVTAPPSSLVRRWISLPTAAPLYTECLFSGQASVIG